MNKRITSKHIICQYNGWGVTYYCIDGEVIDLREDHSMGPWLMDLDDNALTAIRDCFVTKRKYIEKQIEFQRTIEAQSSAQL